MCDSNKVTCPYCGAEMLLDGVPEERFYTCSNPGCRSMSPTRINEADALSAAMERYRPAQKPLTADEIASMEEGRHAWMELRTGSEVGELHPCVISALVKPDIDFGNTYRYWIHRPTAAECRAAAWGGIAVDTGCAREIVPIVSELPEPGDTFCGHAVESLSPFHVAAEQDDPSVFQYAFWTIFLEGLNGAAKQVVAIHEEEAERI